MDQFDVYMDSLSDSALIEAMEAYERGEDPINDDDCLVEAMEAYERDALDTDEMTTTMEIDEPDTENQRGGNPLFEFQLETTQPRQNWRNVLDKQVFKANIHQTREATPRDNLGQQITDALYLSVLHRMQTDPTLQPHHKIHFVLQTTTNQFNHPFQSSTFTLQEFEEGNDRLGTYLQSLGEKLNSNESFDVETPLHIELTFIRTPSPGSGHGKRYRPASAAVRKIAKKSLTVIRNDDDLCAARAIVTMKAWADRCSGDREAYRDYDNMRKGLPIQTRKAKELHRLARVPEGPCGLEAIAQFQAVLPQYQIKVMTVDPPYGIIYKGPVAEKMILLVKTDKHYDGCKSFEGFLSKSYFCHDCDRGYDHEAYQQHPCDGKWCAACKTKDCQGYLAAKETYKKPRPTTPCHLCKRCSFMVMTVWPAIIAATPTNHPSVRPSRNAAHVVKNTTPTPGTSVVGGPVRIVLWR